MVKINAFRPICSLGDAIFFVVLPKKNLRFQECKSHTRSQKDSNKIGKDFSSVLLAFPPHLTFHLLHL